MSDRRYQLKPITLLQFLLEIGLILCCVWFFTRHLQDFDPNKRLHGNEFSYLMSSGTVANIVYQKTGAIPLWNPFIGPGEPLLENPFSFALNPLMTWPVLWWGPLNGSKAAILLHIALFGLGGWLLGRTLRMGATGRLFLALLLAGSGSLTATIGDGFYQMGLSQTYMPWVLAGVIGTLFLRRRWPVVVLAVSTTLMIFAGTFWYVLPTAIGSTIIVALALIHWDRSKMQFHINRELLGRVLSAGIFIIGLSAIRLIPQFLTSDLVDHPLEALKDSFPIEAVFMQYFQRTPPVPEMIETIQHYHYLMPLGFLVGLLIVRVLIGVLRVVVLGKRTAIKPGIWRFVVPTLFMVFLLTVWGQGGVPFMKWLYETVGFFRQWRYVGRMGAAAVLWLACLAALWLDDIASAIHEQMVEIASDPAARPVPRLTVISRAMGRLASLAVLSAGLIVSFDTLANWTQRVRLEPLADADRPTIAFLRQQHPTEFLPVLTPGFFFYFPYYEFLVRASFGNPDYRPNGRPVTIGSSTILTGVPPQYAITTLDAGFLSYLQNNGFKPVEGQPKLFNQNDLYYNPDVPSYAFTTQMSKLIGPFARPKLTGNDTLAVTDITHNIDNVHIRLSGWPENSVLVVGETSYPGWTATINGTPVIVESISNRIGVQLPNDVQTAEVVFDYRPTLFINSAAISGLFFILFTLYALQADRRVPKRMKDQLTEATATVTTGLQARIIRIIQVASVQLARTDIFEPVREGKETQRTLKQLPVAPPAEVSSNGNGAHHPEETSPEVATAGEAEETISS